MNLSGDAVVTVDSDQLRLTLMPRGIEMKLSSLSELFLALWNVLKTLVVHRNRWMHRDIRWSNVIKQIGHVEWYLIDFADAAQSPQKFPQLRSLDARRTRYIYFVEDGSHTTVVDLWVVGYLAKTSKIEREWIADSERVVASGSAIELAHVPFAFRARALALRYRLVSLAIEVLRN
ncbi:hypothetical protein F441_02308 [Phytophthora nicotianae CJ01A1]|uniref:Fungal-type protein kinase domain-containing protein n=2 Tax=Phytophthora nicotianae TaxID=4792 RepID=W2HHL3_PHYNI|nr:hypothetical protein L915_02239 [Phytophthora nicotianae]ETL48166.1 hypothetical protein L916_02197 [Phytophthora nicotianae]ETP24745.1 hypothetical protein F441_02308 [Phytophthora nicotianae CJ01A1]